MPRNSSRSRVVVSGPRAPRRTSMPPTRTWSRAAGSKAHRIRPTRCSSPPSTSPTARRARSSSATGSTRARPTATCYCASTCPCKCPVSGEQGAQGGFELRVLELEAFALEDRREGPLADEEELIGALAAEQQAGRDLGDGHERRPVQHASEHGSELAVGDGGGGGEVHGPGDLVVDQEPDGTDLVRQRDPRQPLPAVTQTPAQPEPEQPPDRRQQATVRRQYRARANVGDTDAGLLGRRSRGLPRGAHLREEDRAGRAGFGEHFVGPVAVVTDG